MDCVFVILLFRWSLGAFWLIWSLTLDQHPKNMFSEGFQLPAVHLGVLNPRVGMQAHQTPQAPSAPAHIHQASQALPPGNELNYQLWWSRAVGLRREGWGLEDFIRYSCWRNWWSSSVNLVSPDRYESRSYLGTSNWLQWSSGLLLALICCIIEALQTPKWW